MVKNFLEAYKNVTGLDTEATYIYEKNMNDYWTCAFCGTANHQSTQSCQCCLNSIENQNFYEQEKILHAYEKWAEQKRLDDEVKRQEARVRAQAKREKEIAEAQAEREKEIAEAQAREQEKMTKRVIKFTLYGTALLSLFWIVPNVFNLIRTNVSILSYIGYSLVFAVIVVVVTAYLLEEDSTCGDMDMGFLVGGIFGGVAMVISIILGIIIY